MENRSAGQLVSVHELFRGGFPDDQILGMAPSALEEGRREKWPAAGEQHSDWNRRAAMYYGRDKIDINPWIKRPRENRAWRGLENQRYVLMDHIPIPDFLPRDPTNDGPLASDLTDLGKFCLDVSDYRTGYAGYVHNLIVYGTGIFKVLFDPHGFGGLGMVSFAAHDPRLVFLSPGARSVDEAAYLIALGMYDLDAVTARFPQHAEEIMEMQKLGDDPRRGFNAYTFGKFGGREVSLGTEAPPDRSRSVEVMELYIRVPNSPEMSAVLGEKVADVDSRIRVAVIVGGHLVVRNEWLPYDHGRIPFVTSQSRYYHDRVWGLSDLEIIESLQQELNRMADKRNAWIELSYFPWVMNPGTSGVPDDAFIQAPGMILHPSRPDHGISFLTPPEVGRHIQYRRDEIHREIDDEMGTFVVSSEILQRNIQPTTVSQAREAGEAPVRMKIRFMEPAFSAAWLMAMDLMRQYYRKDVIVRVLGPSGTMESKAIQLDRIRTLRRIDATRFDVRVGLTGNASLSRAARRQEIVESVQAGGFNRDLPVEAREALLESVEFPGRAKIFNRWRQEQAVIDAKVAQAAAAAKTPPKPSAAERLRSTDPAEVEAGLADLPPDQLRELMAGAAGQAPMAPLDTGAMGA